MLLIVNLLCYSISLCIASLPCSPPPLSVSVSLYLFCYLLLAHSPPLSLIQSFTPCSSLIPRCSLSPSLSYSILHSLFPPSFPCFCTLPCMYLYSLVILLLLYPFLHLLTPTLLSPPSLPPPLILLLGLTPVHVATREGSIDVLKFLFQMGANRNMAVSRYHQHSLITVPVLLI